VITTIRTNVMPRIELDRHLALYTAFHRSRGNKLAHGVLVPIILFTMTCMVAYLGDHRSPLMHLATPISIAMFVVLAAIDLGGASILFAFLLASCFVGGAIAARVSPWITIPIAALVHLVAWYGTVVIGHEKIEPGISTGDRIEDSNLYFRRGYYCARNLGQPASIVDALAQFCIAPLAVVQDALVLFGARADLETRIEDERARILERLELGQAPLGADHG
jgi:uncharacterized membrane protein YGL010W